MQLDVGQPERSIVLIASEHGKIVMVKNSMSNTKNSRKMFEDWWNQTVEQKSKETDRSNYEELERAKSAIKDLMTDRYGSKCEFCIHDNNPDARCRKYFSWIRRMVL